VRRGGAARLPDVRGTSHPALLMASGARDRRTGTSTKALDTARLASVMPAGRRGSTRTIGSATLPGRTNTQRLRDILGTPLRSHCGAPVMTASDVHLPPTDTVLSGPFWPGPVRALRVAPSGAAIRIEAVGLVDGRYSDITIPLEQYRAQVREEHRGAHSFDADPRLFRLAADALRIELAHAFDPQFAVSVSQVDPLPHQLDAVYRHILTQPRIRFLLADDPGAGKTIMAGLVMRELIQRGDVRRVLVLCPKALTDQWRRELWEKFRERFTLLTGESVGGAFGQNAWAEHDRVIASVDLAVQEHILPGLERPDWDLIIFDEAHKLSAYRYGLKIDKTRRYLLAEKLAARTRHLLLMTATPHRGDDENFRLLLALLDPQVFASLPGMRRALDRDRSPYFLRR